MIPASWGPRRRFFRSALFPLIVIVIVVFIGAQVFVACGSDSVSGPGCVGTVTKTYTEYKAGPGITSGNVTIPTGNTRYYLAIKRSDGTFCSKRLDKNEWLSVSEGDTYDGA